MPYPINPGDIVQVTIVSKGPDAQVHLNVLHFKYANTASNPNFTDWVDTVLHPHLANAGKLLPAMTNVMANAYLITEVGYQIIFPGRYRKYVRVTNSQGQINGLPLPGNCAVTFTKRTNQARRWGIGSFHLGGLTNSINSNSEVDVVGFGANLDAIATQLRAAVVLNGNDIAIPVIFSPEFPNRVAEVEQTNWQRTMRVMRRRTVGVGI